MPQAGQRVGEYVLDARIGGGTFGEVWRARHHVWTDQLVAIKIPLDSQYLRNLKGEGVAIHGLVHPNIVRAIGQGHLRKQLAIHVFVTRSIA